MKKQLLIWDFDGVLADTESLWLYNRMTTINKTFGVDWNFEKITSTYLLFTLPRTNLQGERHETQS